ncbi:unnamed protein product [Prorocentrum cordatum]|uniref:Uncharacterized protein n=1 Tax=Prorocentrum cordatum TaxID=2364126 RepID=A0ABN9PUR4_9DINO|nr:unnamed protein product [Polarella glacialis]
MLDVEDLSPEQTTSFVDHCLQQPEGSAPAARWSVAAALQRRVSSKRCSSAEDPASPTKPRAGDGFSGRPARSRSEVPAALAEFAYDVTGGSPRGVLELLSEMERQQLLVPAGAGHLSLAKGCADARWLQDNMRPPQSLLARAFARFERLGPKQQACSPAPSPQEVQRVCAGLAERGSRALRRLPQPRPDGPERTEDDPPSSPRAPPVPRRVSRRASTAGVPRSPGGSDGASASPTRARQVSGTGVLGVAGGGAGSAAGAGAPPGRQRGGWTPGGAGQSASSSTRLCSATWPPTWSWSPSGRTSSSA